MPLRNLDRPEGTGLEPAPHGNLAIPRVDPEHHPPRKRVGQVRKQSGVLDRHTAHDEAIHTCCHV